MNDEEPLTRLIEGQRFSDIRMRDRCELSDITNPCSLKFFNCHNLADTIVSMLGNPGFAARLCWNRWEVVQFGITIFIV